MTSRANDIYFIFTALFIHKVKYLNVNVVESGSLATENSGRGPEEQVAEERRSMRAYYAVELRLTARAF